MIFCTPILATSIRRLPPLADANAKHDKALFCCMLLLLCLLLLKACQFFSQPNFESYLSYHSTTPVSSPPELEATSVPKKPTPCVWRRSSTLYHILLSNAILHNLYRISCLYNILEIGLSEEKKVVLGST